MRSGYQSSYAQTYRSPKAYALSLSTDDPGFPWVTTGLIALFTLIYAVETELAVVPGMRASAPSLGVLVAMGGISRALLNLGEGYRLLTAPLLHGNLMHLIGNVYVFAFAGHTLERLAGRAWMFCVFAGGALAGSAMSVVVLQPSTVSVGASGAIVAMLAALFVLSFRLPESDEKTRNQRRVLRWMILALVPYSAHTDYGAHFGGFLSGILVGLLLALSWPNNAPLPSHRRGAAAMGIAAGLAFLSAIYGVALHYPIYRHLTEDIGTSLTEIARADELVRKYPRNPWAHLSAAQAELRVGHNVAAEFQLRQALALVDNTTKSVFPALENTLNSVLALTVLGEGRRPEAQGLAAASCAAKSEAAPAAAVLAELRKNHLCDGAMIIKP